MNFNDLIMDQQQHLSFFTISAEVIFALILITIVLACVCASIWFVKKIIKMLSTH